SNRRVTPAMRTATDDSMVALLDARRRVGRPPPPSVPGRRLQEDPQPVRHGDGHVASHRCTRARSGSMARWPPTLARMGRGLSTLLLGVVGIGAFLSGLELMITAVALPAIVVDLADWTQLRAASWIINGYLLVSIVVMPLAGQLADRHGVRRVFL